jgi:hypothetical protein
MASGDHIAPCAWQVLDERDTPPLRTRLGGLLATATEAAFALGRVRLALLDLQEHELASLSRCRVLLGRLDAAMLLDAAEDPRGEARPSLGPLLRFIDRGSLEVRSAGMVVWSPDFAWVSRPDHPVTLLGAIRFGGAELNVGPGLTVSTTDHDVGRLVRSRFEELWEGAHDVLPAIRSVLEQAHGMDGPATPGSGVLDSCAPLR